MAGRAKAPANQRLILCRIPLSVKRAPGLASATDRRRMDCNALLSAVVRLFKVFADLGKVPRQFRFSVASQLVTTVIGVCAPWSSGRANRNR